MPLPFGACLRGGAGLCLAMSRLRELPQRALRSLAGPRATISLFSRTLTAHAGPPSQESLFPQRCCPASEAAGGSPRLAPQRTAAKPHCGALRPVQPASALHLLARQHGPLDGKGLSGDASLADHDSWIGRARVPCSASRECCGSSSGAPSTSTSQPGAVLPSPEPRGRLHSRLALALKRWRAAECQRRAFMGVGDGDEDSDHSRHHQEERILGWSPAQLYTVVAAVDLYEDFVPWCVRSMVLEDCTRRGKGCIEAELQIGFKFLGERYVSRVELNPPRRIKTTVSQSTLFDFLDNTWEFNEGPVPGTCRLHFRIDFQFRSALYRKVANVFFDEVAQRMVSSFEKRCRIVYGPGRPVPHVCPPPANKMGRQHLRIDTS